MTTLKCPHCGKEITINIGSLIGKTISEKKAAAAIENGKKGGRPRKKDTGGNESDNKVKPSPTTSPLPEESPKRGKKK